MSGPRIEVSMAGMFPHRVCAPTVEQAGRRRLWRVKRRRGPRGLGSSTGDLAR
jgi:hypothetical protein